MIGLARPYVSLDGGTSFSHHGFGGSAGYVWERKFYLDAGTGRSKNLAAGFPLSFNGRYVFHLRGADSLFLSTGWTYYFGKGKANVIYATEGEDVWVESNAVWNFFYGRVGFGVITPARLPNLNASWAWEAGYTSLLSHKVNGSPTGGPYDHTNLGKAKGIDTGGRYDEGCMCKGDQGIYAQVSAIILL